MLETRASIAPGSTPPPPWLAPGAVEPYELGVDELDDAALPQRDECDDVEIAAPRRRWRYVIPVALAAIAGAALAYVGTASGPTTAAKAMTVPAMAPTEVEKPAPVEKPASIVKPAQTEKAAPVAKPALVELPAPVAKPAPVEKAAPVEAAAPDLEVRKPEVGSRQPAGADALVMKYQRIGHELATLENKRGLELCADIRDSFGSIKINDALKTAESRTDAAALLDEIAAKLERRHGIEISKTCLNNPLAKECL